MPRARNARVLHCSVFRSLYGTRGSLNRSSVVIRGTDASRARAAARGDRAALQRFRPGRTAVMMSSAGVWLAPPPREKESADLQSGMPARVRPGFRAREGCARAAPGANNKEEARVGVAPRSLCWTNARTIRSRCARKGSRGGAIAECAGRGAVNAMSAGATYLWPPPLHDICGVGRREPCGASIIAVRYVGAVPAWGGRTCLERAQSTREGATRARYVRVPECSTS